MKTHVDGTSPKNGEVFVFGSNLAGYHGAGAARAAVEKFGAVMGKAFGHVGDSYAIPTKDQNINTLTLAEIRGWVERFNSYAQAEPNIEFWMTRVGCVLAGYKDEDIAPMFKKLPNVNYPEQWADLIV